MTRTVAVAGASGFIGRHLCARLLADSEPRGGETAGSPSELDPRVRPRWHVVGLSRRARRAADQDSTGNPEEEAHSRRVAWRACDLLVHDDTVRALEGVDVAVYLVHTMLPRGRRSQGYFADHDLVAADNFARAAAEAGVERIVYLGGLIPEGHALSDHLRSRLEVEHALAGHGVPVTALRAGLVVGAGGSSFRIMLRLVQRLPVMLTPSWTATRTHPVALADVVSLIAWSLQTPTPLHGSFDIGGPEVMTYREMMERTARALDVERRIVPVPVVTPRLSALWVRLVTGASKELVVPLVQSLVHPMVARDRALQARADIPGISFDDAVSDAITTEREGTQTVARHDASIDRKSLRPRKPRRDIRAVHRLDVDPGTTATAVAEHYLDWLPGGLGLLRIEAHAGGRFEVGLRGLPVPLLVLRRRADRDTGTRAFLEVDGGLLAAGLPRGDLEFRVVNDHRGTATVVLAIVEGFMPRLPWWLYRWTQAPAHSLVMRGFRRSLRRLVGSVGGIGDDRAELGGRLQAAAS